MDFKYNCPDVAVLLATHNGKAHIIEQIESVLYQRDVATSIIIGDDCSNDSTVELLGGGGGNKNIDVISYRQSAGGAGQSFIRLMCDVNSDVADFFCIL